MRIAVIDDTKEERERLAAFIKESCTTSRIVCTLDEFESGEAFLAEFESEKYDAAFIDIYMPGINGMDTAQKIRESGDGCLIIFCTTSVEHAVQSYRVRAFDYLLKPYTDEQLADIFKACMRALKNRSAFIEVKSGWENAKVMLDDIIFTDYYNHYIQIHTAESVVRSHMSFPEFSKLLLIYPQFLCCYRNCIINMDKVSMLDERDFLMINGERIPIARGSKSELKHRYADYAFSKLNGGI